MAVLCDAGWATVTDTRHDCLCWRINPAVHGRFATAAAIEKERRESIRQAIGVEVRDFMPGATPDSLAELLRQGLSIEAAAETLGISRRTAFRWKASLP
jgi:hypothetical protein